MTGHGGMLTRGLKTWAAIVPPSPFSCDPDADRGLWARLIRRARCADSRLDADQWFPVSTQAEDARREAADAIAVCRACPVRSLCLDLSLRHWDIGRHGIWGGLVAADRASLRRGLLARKASAAEPQTGVPTRVFHGRHPPSGARSWRQAEGGRDERDL